MTDVRTVRMTSASTDPPPLVGGEPRKRTIVRVQSEIAGLDVRHSRASGAMLRPMMEGTGRGTTVAAGRMMRRAIPSPAVLAALLPGALVVFLGFESGGFLPGAVALPAVALAVVLMVHITIADRPWGAVSAGFAAGAATLGLLAAWTLLSATWSDAPARAVTEYDRVLLYLLGFLVVGSLGRTQDRLRWAVRGLAFAAFAVCLCGLVTRLAPDVWTISAAVAEDRLNYPLGYWNALGLLAAIGMLLAFALTCDDRERPVVRVLAAAALPVLGPTLLLTFSRGASAAGAAGLAVLLLAARPRALLTGAIVAVPTVTVAVMSAYGAELLASDRPTTAQATAQGHDVALVVALCVVMAAAARAALLPLDRRVAALRAPARLRGPAVIAGLVLVLAGGAVAAALAAGVPAKLDRQYERFVEGSSIEDAGLTNRLTNPDNNGRIEQWRVALDAFSVQPLRGRGAGTYPLEWDRERPENYQVEDAHSLYIEVLGELGLIGLALVAAPLLLVLGGFAARARGPDRAVGGALLGAGVAWALNAGVDWTWEMPVITLWLFATGGLALAAPVSSEPGRALPPLGRIVIALGCLALAAVPVQVLLSEGPLRESARAFSRGDCSTAIDDALRSIAVLGVRPEPFIVMGYCDVRIGRTDLALRALHSAVLKDPRNWEGHYALALARAAAGLDPRPRLRLAQGLNPLQPLIFNALRKFDTGGPEQWRKDALMAPLPTG